LANFGHCLLAGDTNQCANNLLAACHPDNPDSEHRGGHPVQWLFIRKRLVYGDDDSDRFVPKYAGQLRQNEYQDDS